MGQGSRQGQQSTVIRRGYRQLLAWQKAHELALAVYRATKPLARSDAWLHRQCARSAVSAAANIAEGYSRGSLREYIQFLNIARGSLGETEYYLLFLRDARLLQADELAGLDALRTEAGRLLLGLLRSLQAKDADGTGKDRRIRDEPIDYAAAPHESAGPVTRDP